MCYFIITRGRLASRDTGLGPGGGKECLGCEAMCSSSSAKGLMTGRPNAISQWSGMSRCHALSPNLLELLRSADCLCACYNTRCLMVTRPLCAAACCAQGPSSNNLELGIIPAALWLVNGLKAYLTDEQIHTLQCTEIAEHLAGDMAREDLKGKTLTLKLKTTAFEVRTRAHSLPQHISTAAEIEAGALRLLKAELPIEIRLMGMRMSHFLEVRKEAGQQSIASFVKQGHQHDNGEMKLL